MVELTARQKELLKRKAELQKYKASDLELFHNHRYPWQNELLELTNNHQVVATIAANRVGKSFSIMATVATHLTGNYPDNWNGRKFDKPVDVYVAGVDSNHNRNVLQSYLLGTNNRFLEDQIGTGMIARDTLVMESMVKEKKGVIEAISIKHKTGGYSTLTFKSYSQGAEAIQGFAAHIVVVDEQPGQEFFSEIVKRTAVTDQGAGLVLCSFTPLLGMNEMVSQFWTLPQKGGKIDVRSGQLFDEKDSKIESNINRQSFGMVRAGWDDCPHLNENTKRSIMAATPVYLRDAVSKGIPVAGHGRVYPVGDEITYDPKEVHINKNWTQLIGVDIGFGTKDPAAGILTSYDKETDTIYVTQEFKENVETEDDMARLIWSLNAKVDVVYPRDANRKGFKGQSTVTNMLPKPFENPIGADGKRNIHKQPGFVEINSRLKDGRLKINQNCSQLLREISEYTYDSSGQTDKNEDHLCDALRYNVMSIIQGMGNIAGRSSFKQEEYDYSHEKDSWAY